MPHPLDVHLYVTPRCNLACVHCYYDAFDVDGDETGVLSKASVVDVIRKICASYEADIHLEGGEAFLRQDIGEIMEELGAHELQSLTLTTSGTVPIKISPDLLRAVGDLRISIDGHTDDINQRLRGVALKRPMRTMRELAADAVGFSVRMTISSLNVQHIRETLDFLSANGARKISFFEFQPVGRGRDSKDRFEVADDDFDSFIETLSDFAPSGIFDEVKMSVSPRRVTQAVPHYDRFKKNGFQVVSLEKNPNITVNWNGDVGISPWGVTAKITSDRFVNVRSNSWFSEVQSLYQENALVPSDLHTTSTLLRYRSSNQS